MGRASRLPIKHFAIEACKSSISKSIVMAKLLLTIFVLAAATAEVSAWNTGNNNATSENETDAPTSAPTSASTSVPTSALTNSTGAPTASGAGVISGAKERCELGLASALLIAVVT